MCLNQGAAFSILVEMEIQFRMKNEEPAQLVFSCFKILIKFLRLVESWFC